MRLEDELNSLNKVHDLLNISSIATDFVTSICGSWIGSGAFRSVYDYNLDNRYVVKIEPLSTNCNLVEHMIWNEVSYLRGKLAWVKDWFAPCSWISPNGKILIMRKTKQIESRDKPEKVPAFLWDVKDDNFGWIGKKFVCHDYGQFYNFIHYKKKMNKTKWWSDSK